MNFFNFQDMSFRAKIIMWAVAGIVALALIVWLGRMALNKRTTKGAASQSAAGNQTSTSAPIPPPSLEAARKSVVKISLPEAQQQTAVAVVVRQFVERFGSFSRDSRLTNFDEVRPLVTNTVAAWMGEYRTTVLAQLPADVKGITTHFISMTDTGSDATHHSFDVATQRTETTTGAPRVYYQRILLKLLLDHNVWKIDGAYWQAKE